MLATPHSIGLALFVTVLGCSGIADAAPQFISDWSPGPTGTPRKSVIEGNKAYFAMGEDGLWILDIADRAHPSLIGRIDTPGTAEDVVVLNGHACVADGSFGLQVINIQNAASASIVGSTTLGSGTVNIQSLAVEGEFIYTLARNQLVRLSLATPAAPFSNGTFGFSGFAARSVYFSSSKLWVTGAAGAAGQRTIVINPTTLSEIGRFDRTSVGFPDFFAGSGTVTYWSRANAIEVYDGSGAGLPVLKKTIPLAHIVNDLVAAGGNLYADYPDNTGSLLVLDCSTPLNPTISGLVTTGYGGALAASASAIVTGSGFVFDPPTSAGALPTAAGAYEFTPTIQTLCRSGDRVYVALGHAGFRILDATSVPPLQELGRYDPPLGQIDSVLAEGNLAYILGSSGTGFAVINSALLNF